MRLANLPPMLFGLALAAAGGFAALAEFAPASLDEVARRRQTGHSDYVPDHALQAAASVVLRRYDDARAQGDEAGARRALVEALGLIQSLTARSPADGNLWALLAAIDSGLNGFGASTEAYLRLSQANAPFEFPALRKRVALRLAALDDLGPPDREALTRDIGVLLSAEPKHREIAFMADAARPRAPAAIAFAREAIVRRAPDWAPAFDQFLRARPDF